MFVFPSFFQLFLVVFIIYRQWSFIYLPREPGLIQVGAGMAHRCAGMVKCGQVVSCLGLDG